MSVVDRQNVVYIQWITIQLQKGGNSDICYSMMNDSWKHYAKWNKGENCIIPLIWGT